MKLIIIEGWPASGKATLWSMLDGHPDIYVEPLHSYFYEVIFELFDDEKHSITLNTRDFRAALAKTEYYKYELYEGIGSYEMTAGAGKVKEFEFSFDFHKFDKMISDDITSLRNGITASEFFNLLMTAYFKCLSYKHLPIYFASMSNYFNYRKNNYDNFPSFVRVLQVQRDAVEIYASRLGRKRRSVDFKNNHDFAPGAKKLFREAEIEEILSFNNYYLLRSRTSPSQYLQLQLSDLIHEKKRTLEKLCNFLEIDYAQCLQEGSRDGVMFETDDFQFTRELNDSAKQTLTLSDRCWLVIRIICFNLHRRPINFMSPYSFIRYVFLKIKGYR